MPTTLPASAPAAVPSSQPAAEVLRIDIVAEKDAYRLNEPIQVLVRLRNEGNEPITIMDYDHGPLPGLELKIDGPSVETRDWTQPGPDGLMAKTIPPKGTLNTYARDRLGLRWRVTPPTGPVRGEGHLSRLAGSRLGTDHDGSFSPDYDGSLSPDHDGSLSPGSARDLERPDWLQHDHDHSAAVGGGRGGQAVAGAGQPLTNGQCSRSLGVHGDRVQNRRAAFVQAPTEHKMILEERMSMTGRKGNIGRLLVAVVVCGLASAQAMAISGRALAIGQAFSYANNNPQQPMGSGPLGSSVYTGQSNTIPISPYAGFAVRRVAGPAGFQRPLTAAHRPDDAHDHRAFGFLDLRGSLRRPRLGAGCGQYPDHGHSALTSLAPDGPGTVRGPIIQGEASFRQGNYKQAARQFEAARSASGGSPETMLSLAHAYFAMGGAYYSEAADCLAMALKAFQDLPLVRVRPQDFFGSEQDYTAAYQALEQYVSGHPQDPRALLLLGYIQWRQGLMDKAMDSLEAANKAQPGLEVAKAIATFLNGINRTGQIILSEAPPIEDVREYPWAGIRMGVPGGMKFGPLSSPNQVISGIVEGKDGNEPQLVTLYAYPLAPAVTLNTAMDSVSGTLARFAFIKDMKTEAEAEVPFQTGTALVRIFTYTDASSGSRIATGWVGFIREPQDKQSPRIGYLLGVATGEKQAEDILPTLAAISKTISVSQPRSIPVASTDIAGNTFEDRQLLFSITQPRSWAGRQTEKGFDMGQMDFARGNAVSPQADVIVQAVEANATAKSFGEEAIARTVPKGMVRKILSQGPATLGGQEAYQFVISQGPQDGASGSPSIVAGRLFVQDRPDGTRRLYALVVRCHNAEAKDVEALTDQLASTFKLLQAE